MTEFGRLLLCDLRTDTILATVPATNIFPGSTAFLRRLAFSPDGRELAVGSHHGKVAFLDAVTLRRLRGPIKLHGEQVSHLGYALDGSVLVTGGGFGTGIKRRRYPADAC